MRRFLTLSLLVIYHPADAFFIIKKNRERFLFLSVILLFALTIICRIVSIFFTHYSISGMASGDANLALEFVRMWVPVIAWVIGSYAVTTIMGGESKISEIFTASSFCMVPYILMSPVLVLLSRVITMQEIQFYNLLTIVMWAWVLILFFASLKILNDYSMGKCIGICLLSIFSMLLLVMVVLLFMVLISQFVSFFGDIIVEYRMKIAPK